MRLTHLFIRFYKSFNFDYLRKSHQKAKPKPWEMIEDKWYPYVEIPIDSKVTTIVGANEAGKSQLLSAIEKGISGNNIQRKDFCRYSQFFSLEKGKRKYPDFGFKWSNLSDQEKSLIFDICEIDPEIEFDSFFIFRKNRDMVEVYIQKDTDLTFYEVSENNLSKLSNLLPKITKINSNIALPETVPIRALADNMNSFDDLEGLGRKKRGEAYNLYRQVTNNLKGYFSNENNAVQNAKTIYNQIHPYVKNSTSSTKSNDQKEIDLARRLICDLAQVDPVALSELFEAIQNNNEGHANGIVQKINDRLDQCLNFPKCWSQDRDFKLVISPREYEIAFTIRDRTGTEYSFDERSSGLKYFLSYYVQYCTHQSSESPEILLMDEPDAYLSSQAQQDLLKIFEDFADKGNDNTPIQVIYVTHSPFLINKNHAERIRVLEKGTNEEGTRVVKDAAKNHYEPLRSAFGAFVGETTFIGNCNLVVEGIADQILLAGASKYLRQQSASNLEMLDLNQITIVPAGSASQIPYLVYLARGRDVKKPAVIVLLDSDQSGNDAKKLLQKGGPRKKQLLKPEYIFQIGQLAQTEAKSDALPEKLVEIEDLIPIPIAIEAAQIYLTEICEADEAILQKLTKEKVSKSLDTKDSLFDAIEDCILKISNGELHIEKMGLARNVINVVDKKTQSCSTENDKYPELKAFESNFKSLFKELNTRRRNAEKDKFDQNIYHRIKRQKNSFLQDYPEKAKKEDAYLFLKDMENLLDDSYESDCIRMSIQEIRRNFNLDENLTELVHNYEAFKDKVKAIQYQAIIASQEDIV